MTSSAAATVRPGRDCSVYLKVYEAGIAAVERMFGRQAIELELLKGSSAARTLSEKRATSAIMCCKQKSPAVRPG